MRYGPTTPQLQPCAPRLAKFRWLLAGVSVLVVAVFFFFPPVTVLNKTHLIGYAICHQIPSRTFHINGVPLPLCARCTGIYLGALLALAGLSVLKRHRHVDFPPVPVLGTLVGFIVIMGFDGVNSYLTFFPSLPHLYQPQNWLRLVTGTLNGLAMGVIVFPVVNATLWHPGLVKNEPVLKNFKELAFFIAGAGLIILLVLWQHPLLLYPLTILSTLGVVLMLGMVSTGLALVVTRREACARTWAETVLPVVTGLGVSFLMIGGMDWLRATITRAAGIPF